MWFVVALLVWLDQAHPVVRQPIDAAFLGALFGAILAAFGWLADKAVTLAFVLYQVAVLIGQAIFRALVEVGIVFTKVYGFLGRFWASTLKPFLQWAWRSIDGLARWLKRTLSPAIEFLQTVRRKLLELYARYVRPILDTIEVTRRILQLLAFFHIDWARTLDRKLAELEARITRPLLEAMRALNWAMDWINRIITLDGLLQRLTLIRSLLTYQKDALNVWWQSIHKPLTGEKRQEYQRPLETRSIDAVAADFRNYVVSGGGPDAALIDEHAQDYELRLRMVSGSPLGLGG